MTIAACYLSPEGVILGADSTTTYAIAIVQRRKPRARRKEESLRLRLSEAEKRRFTAAAERMGMNLSTFLRHLAHEKPRELGVAE